MGARSDQSGNPGSAGGRRSPRTWVVGPVGQRLTMDKLPPPHFRHWAPMRKAEVVAAVRGGLLSIEEALERYDMTIEEYATWERAVERFGLPGLRTTRALHYRERHERDREFS